MFGVVAVVSSGSAQVILKISCRLRNVAEVVYRQPD
jgi:hypothetical protein